MSSPSASADREFKTRDAASYDRLITDFDRFTTRFTAPLAAHMVRMAGIGREHAVVDIGTGTGVVAIEAARRACAGRVVGIDLSEPMLARARERAAQAGVEGRTVFLQMDAEHLQVPADSFDVAVSLFALLHFPDPLRSLREVYRVLKPGGRMVIAVGSGPPLVSFRGLVHRVRRSPDLWKGARGRLLLAPQFLNRLVDGKLPGTGEPEETRLAAEHRNRSRRLPNLVREAGFTSLTTHWEGCQERLDTPDEFWDLQRTYSSISRKRLAAAPPDGYEAVRQEFFHRCREVQARGGRLVYHHAAFYVLACKPN